VGSFDKLKPQHVTLLGRGGCLLIAAALAFAAAVLVFQSVYWLRFAAWFDWTDPDGPRFPGAGWSDGSWKGANSLFDLFFSAPVQLSASIAGLILVALYIWVRSPARR
jgi:hypothetical protein